MRFQCQCLIPNPVRRSFCLESIHPNIPSRPFLSWTKAPQKCNIMYFISSFNWLAKTSNNILHKLDTRLMVLKPAIFSSPYFGIRVMKIVFGLAFRIPNSVNSENSFGKSSFEVFQHAWQKQRWNHVVLVFYLCLKKIIASEISFLSKDLFNQPLRSKEKESKCIPSKVAFDTLLRDATHKWAFKFFFGSLHVLDTIELEIKFL